MNTIRLPDERAGLFGWWRATDETAHRALVAASLGWMLDAFDVMLYSMVLAALIADLGITKGQAGMLGSLTLLASAAGGMLFGIIADRAGRTRALMGSVLLYSVFTGLCGAAQNLMQLAVFRVLLGIGMGGEWASGAALVSETWPPEHRGKAFGFMQSSWAIGYAAAAVVTAMVMPRFGWRAVFFVGVLPALFTLWIQRRVEEPAIWRSAVSKVTAAAGAGAMRFGDIFRGRLGRVTAAVTFGFIADAFGRKRTYVAYVLIAAVLLPLYGFVRNPLLLLGLGPFVAFFGTGYFSGFGPLTAEVYPTSVRATAQGFTYNIGRVASAVAPFAVGSLAQGSGFGVAFSITGIAFLLAGVAWIWIPETSGKALD